MTPANLALRAAIHHALAADSGLAAALGGARVYDAPPRGAAFPYVTLGEARVADASSDGGPTQEHFLTLHRSRPTVIGWSTCVSPSPIPAASIASRRRSRTSAAGTK